MNKKNTLQFWTATKTRRRMNMGLGLMGGRKLKCPSCDEEFNDSTIVFKRKFRWTIEGDTPKGKLEPLFVKVAARPQMDIEETEINFLSAKTWIPGKIDWEKITVTFFDAEQKVWEPVMSVMADENGKIPDQLGSFKLCLYDGCGCLIESWEIGEAYISGIRFMELDHSSSECIDVEFDLMYKKDKLKYVNNCGTEGSLKYLPGHLGGCGSYGNRKVTCPKCKHEFMTGPDHNLIF